MADTSAPGGKGPHSTTGLLLRASNHLSRVVYFLNGASCAVADADIPKAFECVWVAETSAVDAVGPLRSAHDWTPHVVSSDWFRTVNQLAVDIEALHYALRGLVVQRIVTSAEKAQFADDVEHMGRHARALRQATYGILDAWRKWLSGPGPAMEAPIEKHPGSAQVICAASLGQQSAGPRPAQGGSASVSPLAAALAELRRMTTLEAMHADGRWRAAVQALLNALPIWHANLLREVQAARTCLPSAPPTPEALAQDPTALGDALRGVDDALAAIEAAVVSAEVARAL